MRLCLVSAPTLCEFGDLAGLAEEDLRRVPLGCLAMAGLLERDGLRPDLVDLDGLYVDWVRSSGRPGGFARHAVEELAAREADVYGLGSICSSYPSRCAWRRP